jgi:hypothetical protein
MRNNPHVIVKDVQVIDSFTPSSEPLAPIITVMVPAQKKGARVAFFTGAAVALGLAAISGLGWLLVESRDRQQELQHELVTAEWTRNEQQRSMKSALAGLELAITERNQRIAALEADRAVLEADRAVLEADRAALEASVASRRTSPRQPHPVAPATIASVDEKQERGLELSETPEVEGNEVALMIEPSPATEKPDSPLAKALEVSEQLAATRVEEPPTLETIKAHIKAGDPLVATNKDAVKAEKSALMRLITNPIFIDSAVLGTSLLVPQSLPLTLAQSRLGRSLTRRSMKKADLDKSAVGVVARDIGNMPITKKRKKK